MKVDDKHAGACLTKERKRAPSVTEEMSNEETKEETLRMVKFLHAMDSTRRAVFDQLMIREEEPED